jgi:hypothetical protein
MAELASLETLLNGYRAEALRQIYEMSPLTAKLKHKEKLVQALSQHFANPEHIKQTLGTLDPTARQVLTYVQRTGGVVEWDSLAAILTAEKVVKTPRVMRSYRFGPEEATRGNPLATDSEVFQDVLARLEVAGLVLGQWPLSGSTTVVDLGLGRSVTIPKEVWPHLPEPEPMATAAPLEFERVQAGDSSLFSRELYILWSYIWQNSPTLLKSSETLSKRDMKALLAQLPYPYPEDAKREDELTRLYFQRRLLESLGLIQRSYLALSADPATARERWGQPLAQRVGEWYERWLKGTWWNEISRLPHFNWRTGAFYEAPHALIEARQILTTKLGEAGKRAEWFSLPLFIAELRLTDRNFLVSPQRNPTPSYYGYYQPRHRYHAGGNAQGWSFDSVTSDAHGWEVVETGVIKQVVTVLHWLGLLDLGLDEKNSMEGLRLTPMGRAVLLGEGAPAEAPAEGARVVVQPNFHIVAFGPVGEGTLIELERFADRLSADRAIEFELTRKSLYRAQQEGQAAADVIERLQTLTGAELPQNVTRTLHEWQEVHERIVIHTNTSLLQVASAEVLESLLQANPAAIRPLSPTVALVNDYKELRHALRQTEMSPVSQHNRRGAGGVLLDDAGVVTFRHKVPDIYLVGRLQQLAEHDEAADCWRLTRGAVQRASQLFGLDGPAQIAAWRELLASAPPAWLEQRIKAWSGYYGNAKLHQPILLELRDEQALEELGRIPVLSKKLKRFKPQGPLVVIKPEELESERELLADFGVDVAD